MKMYKLSARVFFAICCVGLLLASTAAIEAAEWPEPGRQIRMIITHGIGGSVDMAARSIVPYLSKYLGVTVVPENMEGASGRKAMAYVYNSEPDGYTIVVSAHPSRLIGQLMYPDSKYDMLKFTKLGSWTGGDYRSVIVNVNSQYKTFTEMVEASKQKKLKGAGGGGAGSNSQLQTIYLENTIGLNADYIPYEATTEVANAVVGNQVDFGVMPLSSAIRYQKQGEVRILGIHAAERSDKCPDVPTMQDMGFPEVNMDNTNAGYAPPGLPKDIQDKLAEAIKKTFDDPEFQEMAEKTDLFPLYRSPEEQQQDTQEEYDFINSILPMIMESAK
jgi:tripartite-type tricarboxylate transporter receptor subunit TctC